MKEKIRKISALSNDRLLKRLVLSILLHNIKT